MLAIYTRLSKQDDESNSISNQLREGKEFSELKNFQESDIKYYNEDEGVSGFAEIENRPELFNLIQDIKERKIKTVWMRNQNRLERNTGTYYAFVTEIKKANVDVYFGSGEKLDFNDPSTQLQTLIISGFNQYTIQTQSIQTIKSLADNASEGKINGMLPYGYSKDKDGYLILKEDEIEVVKRMFDLSLQNIGTKKIAEILNKENIPTKTAGGKWYAGTVIRVLKNTWLKGVRTYSKNEYPIVGIFDVDYFDKAQNNLKKNRTHSGVATRFNYSLRGLIVCGKCGRNYIGKYRKPTEGKSYSNEEFYMCSSKRHKELNCGNRSISISFIEGLVWNRFFKEKELKNLIDEYFEESNLNDVLGDLQDEIDKLNIQLLKYSPRRQKNLTVYNKGIISLEDFEISNKAIVQEENFTKKEIKNYTEQLTQYQNTIELKEQQDELNGIEKTISFNDKKELIKKYIDSIHMLHNDEKKHYNITINFKIGIRPDKYVVTTFKKEVFRQVDANVPFAHKINISDLKGKYFTNFD